MNNISFYAFLDNIEGNIMPRIHTQVNVTIKPSEKSTE